MECGDLTPLWSADPKPGQVTALQPCPALFGEPLLSNKDAARLIIQSLTYCTVQIQLEREREAKRNELRQVLYRLTTHPQIAQKSFLCNLWMVLPQS